MRWLQNLLCASVLSCFALLVIPAGAQTINANITGGGGSGKCTFEVVVDGVADVQIRYNQGYLQTRSGQKAQWRRLKCNQPLPRNPNNFRFQGIDGRGRQYLLKNPNANNGVAVIRIEDPRGGMEGYTGDILWNGGNNGEGSWGGGNGNWWNDDWNGGGGWGGGGGSGGWGGSGGGSGNWNKNVIPNCQKAIRNKLVPQWGGSLMYRGQPNTNPAGSFIMVQGNATYRDGSGRTGDIQYTCTLHPNGNVADSSYKVLTPNFTPQKQPR